MKSSIKKLIKLFLRSHSVNQERTEAAESAMSIYTLKRPVLSCIIVIIVVYKLAGVRISIPVKAKNSGTNETLIERRFHPRGRYMLRGYGMML